MRDDKTVKEFCTDCEERSFECEDCSEKYCRTCAENKDFQCECMVNQNIILIKGAGGKKE